MKHFLIFLVITVSNISYGQNTAGSLDLSFGNNGIVKTPLNISAEANSLAIQTDGKIVIAGITNITETNSVIFCARYNSDGSLDLTFGTSGFVVTNFSAYLYARGKSIAIQSDGKIIIGANKTDGIVLIRYNSDGTIDNSFGNQGIVSTTDYSRIFAIKIDPLTGKIIVGGDIYAYVSSRKGIVYRYNSSGTLDTTFNSTGIVVTPDFWDTYSSSRLSTTINDLAIDKTGKITGMGSGEFFVGYGSIADDWACKINNDGSMDTSFSDDGMNNYSNFINPLYSIDSSSSMILNPDGSIIAGGTVTYKDGAPWGSHFKVFKIESDGTSVNEMNSITINFGLLAKANSLKKNNDDKYILAGSIDSNSGIGLTSINPDFSLDTSFGNDGKVVLPIDNCQAYDLAIQKDNKIIVVGYQGKNILLARFHGDTNLSVDKFGKNDFSIYPNPTTQNIFLKINNSDLLNKKFFISDLNGRTISDGFINGQENEINVDKFESGIYFIKIDNLSTKFIKN